MSPLLTGVNLQIGQFKRQDVLPDAKIISGCRREGPLVGSLVRARVSRLCRAAARAQRVRAG